MARRGGKAASRRSRQQRRAQRAQSQQAQPRPQQPTPDAPDAPAAQASEPVESASAAAPPVDAFEAADAELRASAPRPGLRASGRDQQRRSVRARTSDFNLAGGSSRLSERAAAEYHYVGRDLRNIGILLVVMVVLLAASAIVVNLLGIGA